MRLSRRDDDLLHLVNHGVRSALEERILRGRLVTAGLKILPGQIADNPEDNAEFNNIAKQEKRAMLARAYRIVHASVGDSPSRNWRSSDSSDNFSTRARARTRNLIRMVVKHIST